MIELSPTSQLLVFGALAVLMRHAAGNRAVLPTPAGAAVMAIGIFIAAALQQLPVPAPLLTEPLGIVLLVVWVTMAAAYLTPAQGFPAAHSRPVVGRFAIGTWVAATAVLARVVLLGIPEWRSLAVVLAIIAVVLWIWFLKLAAAALPTIVRTSSRSLTPGVILLATVSTQALVLVAMDLTPPAPARDWMLLAGIGVGALFYVGGAALVVFSHARTKGWTIAEDWDNTNCILHGAMSITGLALAAHAMVPPALDLAAWYYVLVAFVAVESIEALRLVLRVRRHGWGRGLFTYRVTQWSRNFTFGMFYAFTLQLSPATAGIDPIAWMPAVRGAILDYGPHIVLLFLLAEFSVYLRDRFHVRRVLAINPWSHNPLTRRRRSRDADSAPKHPL